MLTYTLFLSLLSVISFIFLYLGIERILYFVTLRHLPNISLEHIQHYRHEGKLPDECPRVKNSALMEVIDLMSRHAKSSEEQKKEALHNWLEGHKAKLFYRLKWMSYLGQAAFWISFMGFVITGYDALLLLTSSPHLWVPGLYKAISLFALGVMIFVPAILLSKALRIWGSFYLGRLKNALSLMMSTGVTGCPVKHA